MNRHKQKVTFRNWRFQIEEGTPKQNDDESEWGVEKEKKREEKSKTNFQTENVGNKFGKFKKYDEKKIDKFTTQRLNLKERLRKRKKKKMKK